MLTILATVTVLTLALSPLLTYQVARRRGYSALTARLAAFLPFCIGLLLLPRRE